MPRILYRPDPKQFNCHVLAAAIRIVKRRTVLHHQQIMRSMGMSHTSYHNVRQGTRNVDDFKLHARLAVLEELQALYRRKE